MLLSPNHPKLDHFIIETYGFVDNVASTIVKAPLFFLKGGVNICNNKLEIWTLLQGFW